MNTLKELKATKEKVYCLMIDRVNESIGHKEKLKLFGGLILIAMLKDIDEMIEKELLKR